MPRCLGRSIPLPPPSPSPSPAAERQRTDLSAGEAPSQEKQKRTGRRRRAEGEEAKREETVARSLFRPFSSLSLFLSLSLSPSPSVDDPCGGKRGRTVQTAPLPKGQPAAHQRLPGNAEACVLFLAVCAQCFAGTGAASASRPALSTLPLSRPRCDNFQLGGDRRSARPRQGSAFKNHTTATFLGEPLPRRLFRGRLERLEDTSDALRLLVPLA